MQMVAEVVPPKEGQEMAQFTSVTATATYASGQVTLKVDACGEQKVPGIQLEEVNPRPDCYRQGTVLCVRVKPREKLKEPGETEKQQWSARDTYDRSADYVVLQAADGYVLAVTRVER